MTFDITAQVYRFTHYGWQNWYEIFCLCRACNLPTIFLVSLTVDGHQHDTQKVFYKAGGLVTYPDALNPYFEIDRYISLRDNTAQKSPEHLPKEIENAFNEGAACLSIGCNNAAATMFRLPPYPVKAGWFGIVLDMFTLWEYPSPVLRWRQGVCDVRVFRVHGSLSG